jgi:hypothetical protein
MFESLNHHERILDYLEGISSSKPFRSLNGSPAVPPNRHDKVTASSLSLSNALGQLQEHMKYFDRPWIDCSCHGICLQVIE